MLRRLVSALAAMLLVAALTAPVATAAPAGDGQGRRPYTVVHDRTLTVNAADGVLANDSGLVSRRRR